MSTRRSDLIEILGEGHETPVRGTTITWGELGDGPPLVLLHGLQDSHRTWRRAAPFLARRFRVLMPDLAGHGWSGRADAPYTLAWHADVIAAWMEAIGVEKAHLCGHSYGGGVAQWMVLEQRERIDRLALVSSGGLGRDVSFGLRLASFPYLGRRLTPVAMRYVVPLVLRLTPGSWGDMEPEEQERFVRWTRIPGTDRAFQRSLEGVIGVFGQRVQTAQRIGEVHEMPPIALFWGEKDPIIPARHGRRTAKKSVGVTLTTYRGRGHHPHLEVPEVFAHDLMEFLEDPARRPAEIRSS
jgi:pimeloyl-ACP methyl ester carboxylesterase